MPNNVLKKAVVGSPEHKAVDFQLMQLQVLLPSKVFACYEFIESIVIETPDGVFGLLPHRRDCVAAIEPGILTYIKRGEKPHYLAVDQGILIKNAQQVKISIRNVHTGADLAKLKQTVQSEFLSISEQELKVRAVLARLESGFMRGFKWLNTR